MEGNDVSNSREGGSRLSRRNFVEAAGAATAAISFGSGRAGASSRESLTATGENDRASMEIGFPGGQLVVGTDGYDTIADAWDDADDGDTIYVHSSYDAQSAGEQFPIVLDQTEKEVLLTGGSPSGSVVDAGDVDENVIEVHGPGHGDYRNMPLVQNLKIVGGRVGLTITGAPYSSFKDLVIWMTGSHAVSVEPRTDDRGETLGSFGLTFRNCIAWNCGGIGFRLDTDAIPHSTTFMGCHSLFNEYAGVMLRGYSSRWYAGTIQNNGSFGVDARSGCGQVLHGVYFEGNGTNSNSPIDVYAGRSAPDISVESCYFQGHFARDFPNGRDDGQYAVAFGGTPYASVRNCTYRNYDGAFILALDALDLDVHRPSHCGLDETTFIETSGVERLRSDGMIQEADLRDVEGRYRGDMGIHDGSGDALWGPAIWNGRDWISVMDPKVLA
jgi:hypothetical protein